MTWMEVIDRSVSGRSVVPEGDGIRPPTKATAIFWRLQVVEQELQDRLTLGLGDTGDVSGEQPIDEERFAPALRVRPDDGMRHWLVGAHRIAQALPATRLGQTVTESVVCI